MKAVITLDDKSPAKVEINKEGIYRTIHLNTQDLVNFFVSSVKADDDEDAYLKPTPVFISPSLPPNTVKYAKFSDGGELIFIFHPETKANVTYHGDVFENVPFPNLVFCFIVRNSRITNSHVMTYKDRVLREDTELYRFPFSNVYQNGSMCYYHSKTISDLVELQSFAHNWLHLPFNDHLYTQGINNNLNMPLRGIFSETQNKPFNFDMLNKSERSFKQWSEGLLN